VVLAGNQVVDSGLQVDSRLEGNLAARSECRAGLSGFGIDGYQAAVQGGLIDGLAARLAGRGLGVGTER
jgi:hypothetical protein